MNFYIYVVVMYPPLLPSSLSPPQVLRGGAAALPEVAASSTKIDAGDQHTHANPPEQLLAGHLLPLLLDQPLVG